MSDHDEPLRALEREAPPPPDLRDQVRATLRRRGLVRARRPLRPLIRAAAALVLFFGGFLAARAGGASAVPAGPRWLLLLYEDSSFAPVSPIPELVAEYGAWADSLRGAGQLVLGEKLGEVSALLPAALPAGGPPGEVTGLFIVSAPDREAALALARTCPHLRHGGRVLLRPIEAT